MAASFGHPRSRLLLHCPQARLNTTLSLMLDVKSSGFVNSSQKLAFHLVLELRYTLIIPLAFAWLKPQIQVTNCTKHINIVTTGSVKKSKNKLSYRNMYLRTKPIWHLHQRIPCTTSKALAATLGMVLRADASWGGVWIIYRIYSTICTSATLYCIWTYLRNHVV